MIRRCVHARPIQRYMEDGYLGMSIHEIPGTENCGLAIRECNGLKDPGCGYFEIRLEKGQTLIEGSPL